MWACCSQPRAILTSGSPTAMGLILFAAGCVGVVLQQRSMSLHQSGSSPFASLSSRKIMGALVRGERSSGWMCSPLQPEGPGAVPLLMAELAQLRKAR